ncbi:2-keto-4-pentenoate hydratase/2-oxohepta-3-ene-1,7-dioic acid hydratase (catechol pathway) [Burkholderia sp. WP9]|uniref:fumarylacetoacetate hydrolase family protein n=1 Tax=Burkholderia sp. WP9 TaxID=1500263 RepID=UPI00089CF8BB|nr:fumarylacetoacetate hydrolase family protein [Burkholderia sp. WP9]SEF14365.1 2-keto-4-pentenoate hydratase/2-oxohepta-3-ene-1,7-dioic acid hydratase (catechol pathway) [Burkholderia sp. WP9]
MRFVQFEEGGQRTLGLVKDGKVKVLGPASLDDLLARNVDLVSYAAGADLSGERAVDELKFLPPLTRAGKIICVGLNYNAHTQESKLEQPDYPTLFMRANTSLVAHNEPIVHPRASSALDFEGELAVVLKSGGRHIEKADALSHVGGYALFNDGSVRDYQFKTPQWTIGKNFDGTGAFGPELVTPDEVPHGARGLQLETLLNGEVVQSASIDTMVFDIETLISTISEAITLEAGDIIVTGTPSGVGWAREPKLLMKPGDVCEVTVEGFMPLRNPIVMEAVRG